jgi:hypothetical protein
MDHHHWSLGGGGGLPPPCRPVTIMSPRPVIDLMSSVMIGTPIVVGEASAGFCFITFAKRV